MAHDLILAVHLIAAIVWIGFGFYELWLGRFFLANWSTPLGAPLARFIHKSDLAALIATMVVFLTGLAFAAMNFEDIFRQLWLILKLALITAVLGLVAFTAHPALELGRMINALPKGPQPVTQEIRDAYKRIEPWNLAMRAIAVAAVLVSVWQPK
jgi:ABC-type phosphate/phosphonate transport system permease subunit